MAIPLEDWSMDHVTPKTECVKKNGACLPSLFPGAPDQSVILPFVVPGGGDGGAGEAADRMPEGIYDLDAQLLYIDGDKPILDITGAVPQPGIYVLVANYYQPDEAGTTCVLDYDDAARCIHATFPSPSRVRAAHEYHLRQSRRRFVRAPSAKTLFTRWFSTF